MRVLHLLFALALCMTACVEKPHLPNAETMTSGTVTVLCDDAASQLMEPQIAEFARKHADAHIVVKVVSGREAMEALLGRRTRIAIMSRGYMRDEDSLMKVFKVKAHKSFHVAKIGRAHV